MSPIVVWFRNDLRLHDNGSLNQAMRLIQSKTARYVIPVYCYDPRYFGRDARARGTGLPKTGVHRQRFIAESLRDLRNSLRGIDSDLLIFDGRPEDVFAKLLPRGSTIITQKEVTQEEIDIDNLVTKAGFRLQTIWGLTMYDLGDFLAKRGFAKGADFSSCTSMINAAKQKGIEPRPLLPTPQIGDLPFPDTAPRFPKDSKTQGANATNDEDQKNEIPDEYTDTAERFEWYWKARVQGPFLYDGDTGERSVYDDDYRYDVDPRGVMGGSTLGTFGFKHDQGIRGGETAGLKRVTHYLVPKLVNKYKETRNRMLGADYSSKFSSWLAHGCVSPRLIYHRIKEHEEKDGGSNRGTSSLIWELSWRDFFIFYTRTHNPKIFFINGVHPRKDAVWVSKERAKPLFQKWIKGETGYCKSGSGGTRVLQKWIRGAPGHV